MKCEECPNIKDLVLCIECDELLCTDCDLSIHKGGKRKLHLRPSSCTFCRALAVINCRECLCYACNQCKTAHIGHSTLPISIPKNLAVFWDISSFTFLSTFSVESVIQEITNRIASPKLVKLYSDNWDTSDIQTDIEIIHGYGISCIEALLLDASVHISSGFTHILIVVSNISSISSKLSYLKGSTKVIVSSTVHPLMPFDINKPLVKVEDQRFYYSVRYDTIKYYIIQILLEQACIGNIIIKASDLTEKLSTRLRINIDECKAELDSAIKNQIVNNKVFNINDIQLTFISLKVDHVSLDVLWWTLWSLKNDEVSPSFKNIKSKILQAYKLKVSDYSWEVLIQKTFGHSRSYSDSRPKNNMKFDIDNGTIYPYGHRWLGLDSIRYDKFDIKTKDYWEEFLNFLQIYFSNKNQESIPMGRYGCSWLIKSQGPDTLKHLSLGKLLYLINLGLSEDYIRYKNKSIIWSKNFKNLDNQIFEKIENIKISLINIISDYPNGVNLSQIPAILKKKRNIVLDVQELGYKKLKEFLLSISDLEVNSKGLIQIKSKTVLDKERLAELISEIIKEKEYGVTESILQATLQARINQSIDWNAYNVASCEEFIKQYSVSSIEILRTPEYNILFKASESRSYSFFFPFKGYFNSAVLESSCVPGPNVYHAKSYSFDFTAMLKSSQFVPMQRIINISNVPSDMLQKSPFKDSELDEDLCIDHYIDEELSKLPNRNCSGNIDLPEKYINESHMRRSSLYEIIPFHSNINYSWVDIKPSGLE